MGFSQAGISDVQVVANGPDLYVTWLVTPPLAPGSVLQVYVDRRLVWSGRASRCHVPTPVGASGRNVWVEVGIVGAAEPNQDYSASLVAAGGRTERASLSWSGGTYLDPTGSDDLGAFQIYGSTTAGGPVSFAAPVDTIVAYPGGWINDGFGKGGYGEAGFGRAATAYEWQSPPLTAGVWQFAVVPVNRAGTPRGSGTATSVVINAAPRPPALGLNSTRLTVALTDNGQAVIHWLPSPTT